MFTQFLANFIPNFQGLSQEKDAKDTFWIA